MDVESGTAVPRSPVSATITLRGHVVIQDKPPEMGGQDLGPMASELLLASLLACQLSTFAKVAAKRRSDVAPQSIRGDIHFEGGDIARIDVQWTFAKGEAKELDTLTRLAEKACTISKALSVPVHVTHRLA